MKKFDNSFLLLPDCNKEWSLNFLCNRFNSRINEPENKIIINSDCHEKLVKHVVYTRDDSDDVVFDRVVRILKESPEMTEILNDRAEQMMLKRKIKS